jgi:prephenate dehydrogenase
MEEKGRHIVAIIGLGLIGGSLGMALKRAGLPGLEVVGYDKEWGVSGKAQRARAIDRSARDPGSAVHDASLVIIATPILSIRTVMEEIAPELAEGCVVTDTGSVKAAIMAWADELLPDHVHFVGGHPMAGKERSGLDVAEATLFDGAPYCISPSVEAEERAIKSVIALAEVVGAWPIFIDPQEHDSYVAAVSHLPLVLSTALFTLASQSQAWPEMAGLAAGGFRDLTRLASTDPEMSHDICFTNRENLLHWLDRFSSEISRYRELIKGDDEALFKTFDRAQMDRETFLQRPHELRPAAVEPDTLSAGERMLSFLVGEHWLRRAKEMGKAVEERRKLDREELERRLRER